MIELQDVVSVAVCAVIGAPVFYIFCRLAFAAYFKSRNDASRH